MIFVSMTIDAQPGKAEELAAAMAEMMATTRLEAGCTVYTYSRDFADSNRFHLCEMWENEPLMNAHIDAPHSAAFVAVLATHGRISTMKAFGGEVQKHRIRAPSTPSAR